MAAASLAVSVLLVACSDGPEEPSPPERVETSAPVELPPGAPNARPDLVKLFERDRTARRSASDGAGSARLESSSPTPLRAGGRGAFKFVFEAGPEGIATGGSLFFQPPVWNWTPPGDVRADGAPATHALPAERDLVLEPVPGGGALQLVVTGRAMRPGEKVILHYGTAGDPETQIQLGLRAERRARFHFWVDGDGDGVRGLVPDGPTVDLLAGPPERLVAHLPAVIRPGEAATLRIAALDGAGSAGVEIEGTVQLKLPASVDGPTEVELVVGAGGIVAVELTPNDEGVLSIGVEAPGGLRAQSPPSLVSKDAPLIQWFDLHGHTQLSDGTGTPDDYFRYAREVAGLDGVALTDHDHWGIPYLDETPEHWDEIRQAVSDRHEPGAFVAILGYEWTSWLFGHRHVLHFESDGPLLSSADAATDTPEELWRALRGLPALTFAHHSAGDPVATDWRVVPDPVLEPVTEIASVHGSSESRDTPHPVRGGIAGNYVRDALDRGYRLGLIGSGDSHDGHPGLAHFGAPSGGLAGVIAPERNRGAVLEALRARRVYATNGARILLDVSLEGAPMGSVVPQDASDLAVRVASPVDLEAVELVANGSVVQRVPAEGRVTAHVFTLPPDPGRRWLYVRALGHEGAAAWSSPFFFEGARAPESSDKAD